jgi:hypothetical protein
MRQIVNPAVLAAAERFTDGAISDALLADVAAMNRLPLYVAPALALSDLEELVRLARLSYANACRQVANGLRQCSRARRDASPLAWMALAGGKRRLGDANRARAVALRKLREAEAAMAEASMPLPLAMAA